MARAVPTVSRATKAGTAYALAAAPVDGDALPPNAVLHVKNGAGAPITLTVVTPSTVDGLAIGDFTATVPAGGERLVGPFPEAHFRQTSGATKGLVHIDYSSVTSVTRAVIG
jgi:hypothetical protein